MILIYLLFRIKGWEPSRVLAMSPGERALTRGLLLYELHQRQEAAQQR